MILYNEILSPSKNIISIRKRIVDMDVVNDATCTRQSVITRVVIRFLWHDVIHWITATSYDKLTSQYIQAVKEVRHMVCDTLGSALLETSDYLDTGCTSWSTTKSRGHNEWILLDPCLIHCCLFTVSADIVLRRYMFIKYNVQCFRKE